MHAAITKHAETCLLLSAYHNVNNDGVCFLTLLVIMAPLTVAYGNRKTYPEGREMKTSLALVCLIATIDAFAQSSVATPPASVTNANAETLKLIGDTADRICVRASEGGSSKSSDASGSIQLALRGLASKLAQAGVHLGYEQKNDVHSGVLAGQVLDAARDANQCKSHVFDVLSNKLLPDGPSAHTSQAPLTHRSTTASAVRRRQSSTSSTAAVTNGDGSPAIGTMTGGTVNVGGN
ncbi:hypothetical protein BHUM_01261c [Candidatus Burkholderia humilis]|nr:hypothetical protein BHUM_01261c [Candidatus Burkholderia humilis]